MSTAGLLTRPEAPTVPLHPRHDPSFVRRCLEDLMQHYGEWRRLGALYAAGVESFDRCCIVREAVDRGRLVGFQIEGDRRRGYRLTGYVPPERIYMVRPGGEARTEPETHVPGQLELVCEV